MKINLPQRSSGYVDSKYYEDKALLEKSRKKGFCMFCQNSLPPRKRKYHESCFIEWFKKYNPPYLWNDIREKAFKRDNYTCKRCGKTEGEIERLTEISWKRVITADHIIPIALGGEEFNLENIQILCIDCHKNKTTKDQKDIGRYRKGLEKIGIKARIYTKHKSLRSFVEDKHGI